LVLFCCYSVVSSDAAWSFQILEDWETTAPIPDESRGWGTNIGPIFVENDSVFGSVARAQSFAAPHVILIPWQSDGSAPPGSEYVGSVDYAQLGVTRVSFYLRHDVIPLAFQSPRVPITLGFASDTEVPDPENPGQMMRPSVWQTSENEVILGGGWEPFSYELLASSPTLPAGWNQDPVHPETWSQVMTDVDRVVVFFGTFLPPPRGGLQNPWDTSLAEFELELHGGPPENVPSLSRFGIGFVVLFLIGFGLLRLRNESSAPLP